MQAGVWEDAGRNVTTATQTNARFSLAGMGDIDISLDALVEKSKAYVLCCTVL